MATRRQTGGFAPGRPAPAGGDVRPVYENFTPTWEWKQEQEARLLLVYLPGFTKEQIKVSVEGKDTLRVRGERLVGGNKWSRFQEDFRIPDDCSPSGIRAKFEGATLTVTIPKKISTLSQVGPTKQEAKAPTQEAISRPGDQVPPAKTSSTVGEAKKTDGKGIPEGPSTQKVATEPPKSQKGQGERPPEPAPTTALAKPPADGKGVGSTRAARIIPEITETNGRSEGKGNLAVAEGKTPKNFQQEKAVQKEKDVDEKGKESQKAEILAGKVVKKETEERGGMATFRKAEITDFGKEESRGTAPVWKAKITDFSDVPTQKQTTDDVPSAAAAGSDGGFTGKYTQAVKEPIARRGNLNEERQLLLNMGAAILVIVALGTYVSYTIGGSPRNTGQ